MRAYEGGLISKQDMVFLLFTGRVVFWVLYRSLSQRFFISGSRILSVNSSISTCIYPTRVFRLVIN